MTDRITPDVFTADYRGEPGRRIFYIQARGGADHRTYLVEKQQVALMAEKLQEMLLSIDEHDTVRGARPERDPALVIEDPVEVRWRVGTIGLGYDGESDTLLVVLNEVQEEVEGVEADPDLSEGDAIVIRRDQARAFVLHALAAVAEGRPLCQLCGLPMDPEAHLCPASNGHHPVA